MKLLYLLVAAFAVTAVVAAKKKVVCYYTNWTNYRLGNGKFDVEDIDPTLCTHLIYSFVGIGESGSVNILDEWQDLEDNYGKGGFKRFNALREKSPGTKTMIAIGGWNEASTKFSDVVGDPEIRQKFVRNVVTFVKRYEFDGFDVDWEYPNQRGGVPEDVENYVKLLKELRESFDQEGLILSAGVAAAKTSASLSYNISEVSKHVHFLNLMAYDMHGSWENTVGINAPLYPRESESVTARETNVDSCVQYWLKNGAPAEKIVLGVPFYGRSFILANSSKTEVGSKCNGAGNAGPYTAQMGLLGYNEICEAQMKGGWSVVFDKTQRAPYAFKGNQWVGYDDVQSVSEKAKYIEANGLGGAMAWSLDTDDFRGKCKAGSFPLLKQLNSILRGGQ